MSDGKQLEVWRIIHSRAFTCSSAYTFECLHFRAFTAGSYPGRGPQRVLPAVVLQHGEHCSKAARHIDDAITKSDDLSWLATSTCLYGFMHSMRLLKRTGEWLSDFAAHEILRLREVALLSYSWLAVEAAAATQARWPVRPQLHYWDHMLRRAAATRLNPSCHWTFNDKDFNGTVKAIMNKCSHSMAEGLRRWALHFDQQLHAE